MNVGRGWPDHSIYGQSGHSSPGLQAFHQEGGGGLKGADLGIPGGGGGEGGYHGGMVHRRKSGSFFHTA
jgi:hypothetical protein